ncbi:hypothetical protein HKD37_02G004423 [Glycine soja]
MWLKGVKTPVVLSGNHDEHSNMAKRGLCVKPECYSIEAELSAPCCAKLQLSSMASKKRKAPSTPTRARFDRSSFTSQEAWERYTDIVVPRKLLPERNVVRVKGHLVKFDKDTLNTFLKTPVVLEEGENLCTYSKFAFLRPDPQELAAKLCIPGRGFELNANGQPLKIMRKNMTTLAQTWSVISFSNLIPTSDVTLDRAKLIYGIIMKMDMN